MTNVAQLPERSAKPVNELVGANVRWISELRGVSQKELALIIGVTQGSMSRRMAGTTDWAPDEMQKVADRLNVPVSRLFAALPHLDSNQEPAGFQNAARANVTPISAAPKKAHRPDSPPLTPQGTPHYADVTPIRVAF